MQQIIYTSRFYCELCHNKISMPVYGDSTDTFTHDDELEFIDWCRHFHWIDTHRICAICGKLVKSGELELLVNDGKVNIHKGYTDEYERIEHGNRLGHLLIVHENCLKI